MSCLGWILLLASAGGDVYHVHPDGDDEAAGTSPDKPWKTIDRANRHAFRPGDRLLFAGGRTFRGNLVLEAEDAGVTVGSYGGGRGTIRAGLGTAVLVRDAAGIEIRDLVCAGEAPSKSHGCGVAFVNTLPGHVRLRGARIRNVEAFGFGRDPRAAAGKAPGFQPPAGCGLFVGGAASDGGKSGWEDVLIEGCDAHDNEFYGILVTGSWDETSPRYANRRVTIAGCRAWKNSGDPEYMDNHSGSGILVEDCDEGLVDRCVAWENGALCNSKEGGPCGIWTAVSRRVAIQHCESFDNRTGRAVDGDGFDLDGGCVECVLQYNFSHGNDGAGILVYTYAGAPHEDRGNVVRYNVCENNAVRKRHYGEIYVGNDGKGMSGVEIYHNTFLTNQPAQAAVNVRGRNVGAAFRNNLLLARKAPLVHLDRETDLVVFQGNLYWAESGAFRTEGASKTGSLEEWRRLGRELLDGKPVGGFGDPRLDLASPRGTAGDLARLPGLACFLPPAGSPAVDAGLDLKARFGIDAGNRDWSGRKVPCGRGRDIGALERPD